MNSPEQRLSPSTSLDRTHLRQSDTMSSSPAVKLQTVFGFCACALLSSGARTSESDCSALHAPDHYAGLLITNQRAMQVRLLLLLVLLSSTKAAPHPLPLLSLRSCKSANSVRMLPGHGQMGQKKCFVLGNQRRQSFTLS